MTALLIIIYLGTLLYLSLSVNIKNYINLIGAQGIILFGIAILELQQLDMVHFVFILMETLVFKAVIVPMLLYRISKRNKIFNLQNNRTHRKTKGFNMVVITSLVIAACFIFSYDLHDNHLEIKYFTAAISSIILGILFITVNRNSIIHLISFLVIENGVFLLALAVGGEMPMIINGAILLDIFSSVLLIGIFLNRIGQFFNNVESGHLTKLKD
ncbi:MAG: hydrogenase-4 component E [Cyclobacteriaceae bacterium]|jgi:hydrogenase-4 component E